MTQPNDKSVEKSKEIVSWRWDRNIRNDDYGVMIAKAIRQAREEGYAEGKKDTEARFGCGCDKEDSK